MTRKPAGSQRVLGYLLLMLICPGSGTAQDVARTSPLKSKNKESVRVYRRYDKSKNETITSAYPIPESGYSLGGLFINVHYTYPGKTLAIPQFVIVHVISSDSEFQYEDNRQLEVKADGLTYRLGRMDYRKTPEILGNEGFTGMLSLTVPVDVFSRLAIAKKVHIQLGPYHQGLEEHDLKKWRALVETMNQ